MTLTLDEVRKTRFHMARRAGYEVTDVDNFVDKVEATMMHLVEENETLKSQLSSVAKAEPSAGSADELGRAKADADRFRQEGERSAAEVERLRKELEQARSAAVPADADAGLRTELERLRKDNDDLHGQLNAAKQANALAHSQLQQAQAQLQQARPAAAAPLAQHVEGKVERIVVETSEQASPAVVRLVQLATQQAEQVVSEADSEAKRKLEDATRQAHEIQVDARTKAERIESEARVNAEKVTTDAQAKADNLNHEVDTKRAELFSQLESERDTLRGRVEELRGFESNYRSSLTSHLKSQIEAIEKGVFEPGAKPGLLSEPTKAAPSASATPRLDALLADNK